jgi:hypothetical protein
MPVSQKNSEIVSVRSHVYSAVAEDSIDQKQITLCREHCLPTIGLRNYIIKECAPEFVIIGRERVFMSAVMQSMIPSITFYGNTLILQVCGCLGGARINQSMCQDMLRTKDDDTKKNGGDDDDDDNDARRGSSKAANEKFEKMTKKAIKALTKKKTAYLSKLRRVTAEEVEDYSQGSQLCVQDDEGWLNPEDDRNWDLARYCLRYCEQSTLTRCDIYSLTTASLDRLNRAIADYITCELAKVWQLKRTGIVVEACRKAIIEEARVTSSSRKQVINRCLQ